MTSSSLGSKRIKPYLNWAGGKQRLRHEIVKRAPEKFNRYFEPFFGAGGSYFALVDAGVINNGHDVFLSDLNTRLIKTHLAVMLHPERVLSELEMYRHLQDRESYMRIRKSPPDCEGLVPMAAWFVYINRVGFNGLYRENSRGECTTPYGKGIGRGLDSLDPNVLRQCSRSLLYAHINDCDYLCALEPAREGDFVYLDPPYVPTSATACFTKYSQKAFDNAEQVLLRDTARELRERGVHVLLSNSDTPMVRELYRDFTIDTVAATRTISCKVSCRGACKEVMIY